MQKEISLHFLSFLLLLMRYVHNTCIDRVYSPFLVLFNKRGRKNGESSYFRFRWNFVG